MCLRYINYRMGRASCVSGYVSGMRALFCHKGKFVLYDKKIRGMCTVRIRKMAAVAAAHFFNLTGKCFGEIRTDRRGKFWTE